LVVNTAKLAEVFFVEWLISCSLSSNDK